MKSVSPLSQKSEEELRKLLTKKEYQKKDKFCKIGQVPKKLCFIISGIARSYIISDKGIEYNRFLFTNGEFIGALTALIKNSPSIYAIEFLTDCTVVECNYAKLIALMETHNDIGIFHRKNIEKLYARYVDRNIDFLTLDATQRYLNLRKRIPNIDATIDQNKIASHLAISRIQLNRIRKKLLTS